ncbi:MAG TPA: hypothetical protein VJV96_20475 [Candidatus Angelobacter sp.]|nr:hypothetical protein [Candidatus Angelobacter sp.]
MNKEFGMHEEFAAARQKQPADVQSLERRVHRLSVALAVLAVVLILCVALLAVVSWRHAQALTTTKDDILFGRFIHYDYDSDDYVAPVVNAIQFFHDGYSIQFDKLQYTADGMELSGEIGNPNQFRITDLTLTFAVRPYPEKIRDQWLRGGRNLVGWSPSWNIGSATTKVADLEPGRTARFNVTIPRVAQNSDPMRIAVLFSGEHYTYVEAH